MFVMRPHSAGKPDSRETPEPDGPRHCGQFSAQEGAASSKTAANMILVCTICILLRFCADRRIPIVFHLLGSLDAHPSRSLPPASPAGLGEGRPVGFPIPGDAREQTGLS